MLKKKKTFETLQQQYKNKVKGKQKERVSDLLKLYKDEQIFSKITFQRELNRYLGHFNNEGERERHFFETMIKYLNAKSSTDKRQGERQEKRIQKQSDDIETLFKAAEKVNKVSYTVNAILFSINGPSNKKKKIGGETFYQLTKRAFDVKAPKTFPQEIYNKDITKFPKDKKLWKMIKNIMLTSTDFIDIYEKGYVDAI